MRKDLCLTTVKYVYYLMGNVITALLGEKSVVGTLIYFQMLDHVGICIVFV